MKWIGCNMFVYCTDDISFIDDKGNLVIIQDDKSMENASKLFIHRGIYTLISIDSKFGH